MARKSRPRWSKGRSRWYACVGYPDAKGRRAEVWAPRTIGPHDEAEAWEWFAAEVQARKPAPAPCPEPEPEPKPSAPREPGRFWTFDRDVQLRVLADRALDQLHRVQVAEPPSPARDQRIAILARRRRKLYFLARRATRAAN